jgi:hypothetical protein
MDDNIFSFTSNPTFQTSSTSTTLSAPSQLETLAIIGLSTLESLLDTSEELFNSLLEYSTSKEGGDENNEEVKRQKVIQCYEKYKRFEKDLKGHIDNIVETKNQKEVNFHLITSSFFKKIGVHIINFFDRIE